MRFIEINKYRMLNYLVFEGLGMMFNQLVTIQCKNVFNVCHFSAPDKNPQNIRVQASQPKEMIIKWEVCNPYNVIVLSLDYLFILSRFADYNDITGLFKNNIIMGK